MTALFDAETAPAAGDAVDEAFELIRAHIRDSDPRAAVARIRRYKSTLSALETEVAALLIARDGNDRQAKRVFDDGKTSKRSVAKAAARGAAAAKNADLVDKVASGDLSEEQMDVIAGAAAKTDGAAAIDEAFIDKVAAVGPDQGEAFAKEYVADKADPDGTQSLHDRQRAQRKASKYNNKKTGLETITLEGDAVSIQQIWDAMAAHADVIYRSDGGRDLLSGKHPRTFDQRLFDALHELACGVTITSTGSIIPTPRGHDNDSRPSKSAIPAVVIHLTLDEFLGVDNKAAAEQIGLGVIPESVLANYLAHAEVMAMLFDTNGEPLWIGRGARNATIMQRYALMIRDKHCVLCTAPAHQCEAHHTKPWTSPLKGQTNIDELVLLCGPCHRKLHADNKTTYQARVSDKDPTLIWKTRPSTAAETPHPQRNTPKRE